MEVRNTDGVFKYSLDRLAAVREFYKRERAVNTVALKADAENSQYKLFANGELLATLDEDVFKFIKDISGVDNVTLGATMRQGKTAYPFGGTIHNVKVYDSVLSDEELIKITGVTEYGENIFYAGDETKSNYFRIPSLLTLSSGTVISAADARYGGTHDSKSKINIAFAKSTDEGNTWSDLKIVSSFKPENSKFLVVGPGVGKQISKGEYAGRLIVTLYSQSSAELGFMYSDDHGDN